MAKRLPRAGPCPARDIRIHHLSRRRPLSAPTRMSSSFLGLHSAPRALTGPAAAAGSSFGGGPRPAAPPARSLSVVPVWSCVIRLKCDYLCKTYVRAAGTHCGPDRLGFYWTIRGVPPTGWATSAASRRWTFGTADDADLEDDAASTLIFTDGHGGPRAPGACSRSHEQTTACPGTGLALLESIL
jgi:hypothetical protein